MKISARGRTRTSARLCSTRGWSPSGPDALLSMGLRSSFYLGLVFMLCSGEAPQVWNLLQIFLGENSMEESIKEFGFLCICLGFASAFTTNVGNKCLCLYSQNARVCAKWQWTARDCVTELHDRRSRECNPVTPVECVSLSFRTPPCVLAFITYILCTNGIEMAYV